MKRTPVLLVDMDGTLVDTTKDLALSVNATLAAMDCPTRPEEEIRSFVGQGATVLLLKALGTDDPARIDAARNWFFAHYDEHLLDHSRLFAGWDAVLRADVRLVCATNKPERFAAKILEGLGIRSRFEVLIGGDTLPVRKPDPGVAVHIAEAVGVQVSDLVIVGDGEPDGRLGRACGFPFWAAAWGYGSRAELDPFATLWLQEPQDILAHLGA